MLRIWELDIEIIPCRLSVIWYRKKKVLYIIGNRSQCQKMLSNISNLLFRGIALFLDGKKTTTIHYVV